MKFQDRKSTLRKLLILASLLSPIVFFGVAAVLAAYTGPDRTTTTYTYERLKCSYHAVHDPPGPAVYGCNLTLYAAVSDGCPGNVGDYFDAGTCGWSPPLSGNCNSLGCSISSSSSTESCSAGDTGCRGVAHTTSQPPATISGVINCSLPLVNGWCPGSAVLVLTSNEPLSGHSITAIEGTLNGNDFSYSGAACNIALEQGTNAFTYWAVSDYPDTSYMGSASGKLDSVAPALNGSLSGTVGDNNWFVSPVTISMAPSDAASGVASQGVSLDGSTWSPSLIVSSDGSYTAYWTATDKAGNSASTSQAFQVDRTPPSLSVTVPTAPASGWFTGPVSLSATASDATSGLASLGYSVDGGAVQYAASLTLSSDGSYSVDFQAADNAGNIASQMETIQIDQTAPSLAPWVSGTTGSNGWYLSPVTIFAGASDPASGLGLVQYSLDGGSSWNNGNSMTFSANGTNSVAFRATDLAGNTSGSVTRTVHIDTTDPTFAPSLSGSLGTNGWYTSPVTVDSGVSDTPSGVNSLTVMYWADGGPAWAAGSSHTFTGEGAHAISFQADDNAGNYASSATLNLKIDTQAPSSTFLSPAEGTTVIASGDISLSGQVTDATSGVASAALSLDGGNTWLPLTLDGSGRWSYPWTVDSLSKGSYIATVRTLDLAGNTEQSAHVTVVVDNSAPHVSITPYFFVWYTAGVSISPAAVPVMGASITVSDPLHRHPDRVLTFDGTHLPTAFLWDRQMGDVNTAPIGIYNVTVAAWDDYGHTGQASGQVIVPAPGEVLPTSTPGSYAPAPTRTPFPTPSETATPVFTATATLRASPTPTATKAVSVVGVANPPGSIPPTGSPIPTPTEGVLWGAAATAAIAATGAVIAEEQRKRREAEAAAAAAAAQFNSEQIAREEAFAAYMAALNRARAVTVVDPQPPDDSTIPEDEGALEPNVAEQFRDADEESMEEYEHYKGMADTFEKNDPLKDLFQAFNWRIALPEIPLQSSSPLYHWLGGYNIGEQLTFTYVNDEKAPTLGTDAIDLGSVSLSPDKVMVTPLDSPIKTGYQSLGASLGVNLPDLPIDPWEISFGVDIHGQSGPIRADLNVNFDYVYRPDTLLVEALAVGTIGVAILGGTGIVALGSAAAGLTGVGLAGQALSQALH